jgi:hypothetical protein
MPDDPPSAPPGAASPDQPAQEQLPLVTAAEPTPADAPPATDEEGEPAGGFEASGEGAAIDEEGETETFAYTTSEFHNVIQKQIIGATYEMMVESKLPWEVVEPFLRASRDMFRGDFERTGRVAIHGVAAGGEDGEWVDAEEAYLSLSVADQDDGRDWLSETWWLSDLVIAEGDPTRVREAARALERSVAKLDAWLAANDSPTKGPDDA